MNTKAPINWNEKRKAKRRDILDHFSFYACLPKLGFTRHVLLDVSEMGVGLSVETLGMEHAEFKLQESEQYELHLYLNQSLHLPLTIQVVRCQEEASHQVVGAIFTKTDTPEFQALLTLVRLLDQLEGLPKRG